MARDNKKPNFLWIFLLPCGYNTKLRRLGGIFTKKRRLLNPSHKNILITRAS